MNKNKDYYVVPPAECTEKGCKVRSDKCKNCHWNHCTWFYVPKTKNNEQK